MKREESRGLEVELRSEALQTDMDEDTESWRGRGGEGGDGVMLDWLYWDITSEDGWLTTQKPD